MYVAAQTDTVITVSIDGFVKFWRKVFHGVEFMHSFHAHTAKCTGTSLSWNGRLFASVSSGDTSLKLFDVVNADMINMYKFKFEPGLCEFIYKVNEIKPVIAVVEFRTPNINIIQLDEDPVVICTLKLHSAPVRLLVFNPTCEVVVSTDSKGIVEYWDANTRGKHWY